MNRLDIAEKLALITGKPVTEFFNESRCAMEDENKDEIKSEPVQRISEVEGDRSKPISTNEETSPTTSLLEYQKMFEGSRIVNKKILGGKQMTKKEYRKIIKGMSRSEMYKHPLMHKMFRAEGQNEAQFPTWCKRFLK